MNNLTLKKTQELAAIILDQYKKLSDYYSSFQNGSKLECLNGCGRCCFKEEIHCTPIELLPLALEIVRRGEADFFYEKAISNVKGYCIFLDIKNLDSYQADCSEYEFRPIICRTFGVSARNGKKGKVDFSVCKTIKEHRSENYLRLLEKGYENNTPSIPYIDLSHRQLSVIDPQFLEETFHINTSFRIILEKVLMLNFYLENEES